MTSQLKRTEVRIRGVDTYLPSVDIDGCTVIRTGRWLRVAQLFDEELVERKFLPDPKSFLSRLKESPLKADIFICAQRPPDVVPHHSYTLEWDNWAMVPTKSFDGWWTALPQESRKNVRLAEKRGVTVRAVNFDDQFVAGIKKIYDETPVRQGRQFWHYGKPLEAVRKENSTYLDRSLFVGAYLGDELIGFIKSIRVDDIAVLIQIIALNEHRDKRPMNALLSHTINLCSQGGYEWLTYGKYNYGMTQDSSLAEFKRRNGFQEIKFPRYYIPLTTVGKIALSTGAYKGWKHFIPSPIRSGLLRARAKLKSGTIVSSKPLSAGTAHPPEKKTGV